MAPDAGGIHAPSAVIFDLDSTLLDSRKLWQYAVEESVAATCGRRIDARPLVEEYHRRPWLHALTVLALTPDERSRGEALCIEISQRSGLKKLLPHEGMGMALDALHGTRIEVGAITRQPHALALKQAQSTGLDRFLAVLAATPADTTYDPAARLAQCVAFLERRPSDCTVVSADSEDWRAAENAGFRFMFPAWVANPPPGAITIPAPAHLLASLLGRPGHSTGR